MILLVLHGETEWNRQHRFQGRLDSPLTPDGVQQARRAAKALSVQIKDLADYRIVCSPLGRARQTMEIICSVLGLSSGHVKLDPRLMEIDLGSWSGLTRDEIEAKWPRILDGANGYDWYLRSPDGEPLEAITARLREWLTDVEQTPGTTIAISHGLASLILRGLYTNLTLQEVFNLEFSRDTIFKLSDGRLDSIRPQPT